MKIWLLLAGATLALASCSILGGAPDGAFPKQIGSMPLISGPGRETVSRGGTDVARWTAKYKAASGKDVEYSVTVYGSAEAAKKVFADENDSGSRPSDVISYMSGSRRITVDASSRTIVTWIRGSWYCEVASSDQAASQEFADQLPDK